MAQDPAGAMRCGMGLRPMAVVTITGACGRVPLVGGASNFAWKLVNGDLKHPQDSQDSNKQTVTFEHRMV